VRQGSYDYVPPDESFFGHIWEDVIPAYVYGTGYCIACGEFPP
jgi:hypothetical protein